MNELRHPPPSSLVTVAVAFELALALLGWLVAWVAGVPLVALVWPVRNLAAAVAYGVLATIPLMPLLAAMLLCYWRPIAWLRRLVTRFVRQLFGRARLWQLALVSLAAGIGEEVLFRGALQSIAVDFTTPMLGIAIASVLFGAVHAASWSYFWLATLVGAYLGLLAEWRGEILSAAIAHALYDFVALTCIARGCFQRHRPLFSVACGSAEGR
jgi:uncharacterized protein